MTFPVKNLVRNRGMRKKQFKQAEKRPFRVHTQNCVGCCISNTEESKKTFIRYLIRFFSENNLSFSLTDGNTYFVAFPILIWSLWLWNSMAAKNSIIFSTFVIQFALQAVSRKLTYTKISSRSLNSNQPPSQCCRGKNIFLAPVPRCRKSEFRTNSSLAPESYINYFATFLWWLKVMGFK